MLNKKKDRRDGIGDFRAKKKDIDFSQYFSYPFKDRPLSFD